MDGVGIGVQETDGQDRKTLLLQPPQERHAGRFIERLLHRPGVIQALRDLVNVLWGHQTRRLHPEIHMGAFGHVMAPNMQHVAAPGRGQEGEGRALALDDHVGRNGRPVQRRDDIPRSLASLL